MKTSIIIFSAMILASLLLWQCQRTTHTKADFPDQRLTFGSGGGFTGAVTSHHLLPNGQLFKSKGLQPDTSAIHTIKRGKAKSFFKEAEELGLLELEFNQPGNMYYFMQYYTEGKENKITWGANGAKIPDTIKNFYDQLNDLLDVEASKE